MSMQTPSLPSYLYTGARSMVRLHEKYLRDFLDTWLRAREAGIQLPETNDPSYSSPDALLYHVLGCARSYMVWMCEVLGLPDPEIRTTPKPEEISGQASDYLEHVVDRWRTPLAGVSEERFNEEHPSRWKVVYCVDAMMEHAVMHPIRHAYQLQGLLDERASG